MMEFESAADNVSVSEVSSESASECLEGIYQQYDGSQMVAILPCCQLEQQSLTEYKVSLPQLDPSSLECCINPDLYCSEILQVENSNNHELPVEASVNDSMLFCSIPSVASLAVHGVGSESCDADPSQQTACANDHSQLLPEQQLSFSSLPVVHSNNSVIETKQPLELTPNSNLDGNLWHDDSELKCFSNDTKGTSENNICMHKDKYLTPSIQLRQQDDDDDVVEQLLQEIDTVSKLGLVSDSAPVPEGQHSDSNCDNFTQLLLPKDKHFTQQNGDDSFQTQLQQDDTSSSKQTLWETKADNDDLSDATFEEMTPDQVSSAYNVLLHKYLLLKQQNEKQLATQQKLENDKRAVSFRLKSVMTERDNYLTKLSEFEEHGLMDSEEVKLLEVTVEQQKQQILLLKEKLSSQESAFIQAATSSQSELNSQIEQARKKYEDSEKDKQSMVMKYAQAEQKNIELHEKMTKMDGWMKDWMRQRDNLMGRLNATAAEKQKLTQLLENRATELVSLKREIERQKELVSSQEMKAKWHQNKLKVELELHKETKVKMEETFQKLKESKDECEKIRLESQSVIKTYQMSQVMDSITKELQLKETEEELLTKRQEQTEQKEVLQMLKQELDSLKMKEKELVEELHTYKDKVICLEAERVLQEETLTKFKDTLQNQKKVNKDMMEQVAELESLKPEINNLKQQLVEARKEIGELKQENKDLMSDIDGYMNQESEHLKFSQRLSDETVRLQSENLALGDEIASLTETRESLKASISCLSTKCKTLESDLSNLLKTKRQQTEELEKQLKEQTKLAEERAKDLEDREDELKTLKRRHLLSSKDLKRQLSQLQKRLDQFESKASNSTSSTLSRTSSSGSLDSGSPSANSKDHLSPSRQVSSSNILSISDIDKEVLIDKIIRLQKTHARKNEKIEFMQDHVNQLLEEVKKKTKIIQNYIMREESYSLIPAEPFMNSRGLAPKKGGIMTSMFVSSETGRDMYEDLAEHNSRLQTVLEDKVIHNLTLKHTVETLGQEVSHLSNENRRLHSELQRLRNQ